MVEAEERSDNASFRIRHPNPEIGRSLISLVESPPARIRIRCG
jgi:hypothetical protein